MLEPRIKDALCVHITNGRRAGERVTDVFLPTENGIHSSFSAYSRGFA